MIDLRRINISCGEDSSSYLRNTQIIRMSYDSPVNEKLASSIEIPREADAYITSRVIQQMLFNLNNPIKQDQRIIFRRVIEGILHSKDPWKEAEIAEHILFD